ncbi:MAG: hypothetical protein WCG05_04705 [Alphaproteobacteria bacterium]
MNPAALEPQDFVQEIKIENDAEDQNMSLAGQSFKGIFHAQKMMQGRPTRVRVVLRKLGGIECLTSTFPIN